MVDNTLWLQGNMQKVADRVRRIFELMIGVGLWPADALQVGLKRFVETSPAAQAHRKVPAEPEAIANLMTKPLYQAFATRTVEWAKARLDKEKA
jgi:hypothetical protein